MKITVDTIHNLSYLYSPVKYSVEKINNILPIEKKIVATSTKGSNNGVSIMSFIFSDEGKFQEFFINHKEKGIFRYKMLEPTDDNLSRLVGKVNAHYEGRILIEDESE